MEAIYIEHIERSKSLANTHAYELYCKVCTDKRLLLLIEDIIPPRLIKDSLCFRFALKSLRMVGGAWVAGVSVSKCKIMEGGKDSDIIETALVGYANHLRVQDALCKYQQNGIYKTTLVYTEQLSHLGYDDVTCHTDYETFVDDMQALSMELLESVCVVASVAATKKKPMDKSDGEEDDDAKQHITLSLLNGESIMVRDTIKSTDVDDAAALCDGAVLRRLSRVVREHFGKETYAISVVFETVTLVE